MYFTITIVNDDMIYKKVCKDRKNIIFVHIFPNWYYIPLELLCDATHHDHGRCCILKCKLQKVSHQINTFTYIWVCMYTFSFRRDVCVFSPRITLKKEKGEQSKKHYYPSNVALWDMHETAAGETKMFLLAQYYKTLENSTIELPPPVLRAFLFSAAPIPRGIPQEKQREKRAT